MMTYVSAPFTSDVYPQRKGESIFVQIQCCSLLSLTQTGHSSTGLLASNGHSQLLNGLGGGGIAVCQKGAKNKERTGIHQGNESGADSLRQNVRFSKANAKGQGFPAPSPGPSVNDSIEADLCSTPEGTFPQV
jgi:hypothetical protein